MKRVLASLAFASLALSSAPALAERSDQGEARKEMRAGNVLPLREIESRIVPDQMRDGAQYLGPAYDSTAMAYRLKFIKGQRVTYVDVDARSGRIIGISR